MLGIDQNEGAVDVEGQDESVQEEPLDRLSEQDLRNLNELIFQGNIYGGVTESGEHVTLGGMWSQEVLALSAVSVGDRGHRILDINYALLDRCFTLLSDGWTGIEELPADVEESVGVYIVRRFLEQVRVNYPDGEGVRNEEA